MKTIKFTAYLFYRYYLTGPTKYVPYFHTLASMVLLTYFHLFQIAIITDQVNLLVPVKHADPRWWKYIVMALITLPIFLIYAILIKKKELKELNYPDAKVKHGNILLIIYLILSFCLLFVLAFIFRKN